MAVRRSSEPVHATASVRLMTAILQSALGPGMGRSLTVLRLRGRTSGRLFALVVQYAEFARGLVVMPGDAESKQWWRNLREPQAIDVLRGRTWQHMRAEVVLEGNDDYELARSAYRTRWPRVDVPRGQPLVIATWLDERDQAATASSR